MKRDMDGHLLGRRRWIADIYTVLPNAFEAGIFRSDHRCVVADILLFWM